MELEEVLATRSVPWREDAGRLTCATPDPAAAMALGNSVDLVLVGEPDFQRLLRHLYGERIAQRALARTPGPLSVRSLAGARHGLVAALLAATGASVLAAGNVLVGLTGLVLILAVLTTLTRLAALLGSRELAVAEEPAEAGSPSRHRQPATISLLIPLYREAAVLPRLLEGLERLDYPRDRLEVKLLLEADDTETAAALEGIELPPWIEALTIPPGSPRTKPRALNVALDFCHGEIVGVLDAEDRPDPAQLRIVAEHLRRASDRVAAVQCQLAYFNARENWITRCFQIEYSIWFDVLLRGWQRLGLPIPLGGTSVYFRRASLVELGGWDAHNVTEDADLGMRIARAGLTCDVVGSTTDEEANCRVGPWIRQRSRWLKGYMMTWLCHMRRPVRLWKELGPAGFLGFQVLLLGGAVSYLAIPLFWVSLATSLATGATIYGDALPGWALVALASIFALGQVVMLAAATLALARRRSIGLIWWVPVLPIYWTLGAIAAWKAIVEVAVAPYFWDKTRHGITRIAPDANPGR